MNRLFFLFFWSSIVCSILDSDSADAAYIVCYFQVDSTIYAFEDEAILNPETGEFPPVYAPGMPFDGQKAHSGDLFSGDVGNLVVDDFSIGGWNISAVTISYFTPTSGTGEGLSINFNAEFVGTSSSTLTFGANRFVPITTQSGTNVVSTFDGGGIVTEQANLTSLLFEGGISNSGDSFVYTQGAVTETPTIDTNGDFSLTNTSAAQSGLAGTVAVASGFTITASDNLVFQPNFNFYGTNLEMQAVPEPGSVALVLTAIAAGGGIPAWKRFRKRPASKKCVRRQPKVTTTEGDVSAPV